MAGRILTVDEVITEASRDTLFYDESGGGVTFSGGEPLMQGEFVSACMDACKRRGICTALDTCGHASTDVLLACAECTDLILYDLKLIDADRHERQVGVSNSLILENLRRLDDLEKVIWVRVPVIPGVNDDDANVKAIADFVLSLRTKPAVQLLPYHRMGSDKYERLGLRYTLPDIEPPTRDDMNRIADGMRSSGVEVSIGG
jgi:pyruvate formate lyase activating enzyme